MAAELAANLLLKSEVMMTRNQDLARYLQNASKEVMRFKYIHIWSTDDEARIKATDPQIIGSLLQAIEQTYPACEFDTDTDLTEQVHFASITNLDPKERHHQITWWMFKILCDRGWEPMEVSRRDYRLKLCEVVERPFQ
jgi:hypothetical protein